MIRVTGSEDMEFVFNDQQMATMKTFGECDFSSSTGICQAGVNHVTESDGVERVFLCTRDEGHPGPHVAVGIGPVAIFDVGDFEDSDAVQF